MISAIPQTGGGWANQQWRPRLFLPSLEVGGVSACIRPSSVGFALSMGVRLVNGDWIKLHRKILKSQVFANAQLLKVWVYCLARANWNEVWVPVKTGRGTTQVHLLSGQFLFGRKKAAKRLKMTEGGLRRRIAKLAGIGNIIVESTTHYSVVSVCNWPLYQKTENEKSQPSTNQAPTKHHRRRRFKKV